MSNFGATGILSIFVFSIYSQDLFINYYMRSSYGVIGIVDYY